MTFELNTLPAAAAPPLGEPGRLEWTTGQKLFSRNWCKVEACTSDEMFLGGGGWFGLVWQKEGNSSYPGNSLIFLSLILGSPQGHHFRPITAVSLEVECYAAD